MNAFKALLIKDLQTNKKGLSVTVWIVLGLYLVLIASFIYATKQNTGNVMLGGIPMEMFQNPDVNSALSFAVQVALMFSFLGFMFAIQMVSISTSIMNTDVRHKCELFHRSQPVSVWQLTASRFAAGIGGFIALTLVAGIIQYFVATLLLFIPAGFKVDWWMGLNGMLLSWAHLSVSLLVLGSIGFLLSTVFKDNAFGKGALILGGIQVAIWIINYLTHLGIPSPVTALANLVMSNIRDFTSVFPSMQYGIQFNSHTTAQQGVEAFRLPPMFLGNLWSSLFTWGIALKLAVSGILYVLSTCLYQRREVQF